MSGIALRGERCTSIEILSDVVSAAGVPEDEFRQEIAVTLYQRGVSTGRAAKIARLSLLEFQALLAEQEVPLHYGVEDFEDDLKTLREMGQPWGS